MSTLKTIDYKTNVDLTTEQVINLYKRCSLGERRPVDSPAIFRKMIDNASFIITAWDQDRLVGLSRALSDISYVTYLADLVVDEEYQQQGIGKQLIQETGNFTDDKCMLVLLAAPAANEYYPKIGFEHNPRAWIKRKSTN